MIKCPNCGLENAEGTIVCTRCFAVLKPENAGYLSTTLRSFRPLLPPPATGTRHGFEQARQLTPNSIALYIEHLADPIIIEIAQRVFLGRLSSSVQAHPLIDLNPFDAFAKGVSRLHAVIHRTNTRMAVEDLGSSNGTYLNGARLEPHTIFPLRTGDKLQLGKLVISVYPGIRDSQTLFKDDTPPPRLDQPST